LEVTLSQKLKEIHTATHPAARLAGAKAAPAMLPAAGSDQNLAGLAAEKDAG
jgi:hypothetical protein